MTKADSIFVEHIKDIIDNGVWSENARPRYADGSVANSKYITMTSDVYDLSKGEFPITTLRPIAWKTAIKEMLTFYQRQSNKIKDFKEMGVGYWDAWQLKFDDMPRKIVKVPKCIQKACYPSKKSYPFWLDDKLDAKNYRQFGLYYVTDTMKDEYSKLELSNLKKLWEEMIDSQLDLDGYLKYGQKGIESYLLVFQYFVDNIKNWPQYEFAKVDSFNPDVWTLYANYHGQNPYCNATSVFEKRLVASYYEDYTSYKYTLTYLDEGKIKEFLHQDELFGQYLGGIEFPTLVNKKYSPDMKIRLDSEMSTQNELYRYELLESNIGNTYGYVVGKHKITDRLLNALKDNPWNRRNIVSLWDYESFDETKSALLPCAWNTMFDVRKVGEDIYLDQMLTMRSNDMLVAQHMDTIQYVALQMMIAKQFGWKLGKFRFNVMNMHIYSNQFEQAEELLKRYELTDEKPEPTLVLNVPDGTNFYRITVDDFEMKDYDPVKPQIKFPDLAV